MNSKVLSNFGFSQYETRAYLSLLGKHPVNGSQLSRYSGIPRARIYDVLRTLKTKGLAVEVQDGLYAPLPPEEAIKRFRTRFENEMTRLERTFREASVKADYDFVWNIQGYDEVMDKAREMIESCCEEIYARLFPEDAGILNPLLHHAAKRGVQVKYISMGNGSIEFDLQVNHPQVEEMNGILGGRSIDIVSDRQEVLVGLFETGKEDLSPISWAKNHWFVIATRDSLRHDFFHYFLHKTYDLKEPLTGREAAIYELIKSDL